MSEYDAAVVGGGLIGGSIAFELAAEKLRVLLLDRQQPGREASWAAGGMISQGPHLPSEMPLASLARESVALYPTFIAMTEEFSGRSTSFTREGALQVFPAPHGEGERDRMVAEFRSLGIAAEPVSLDSARKLEPGLGPAARAAAWLPEEATVDPRLLTDAVLAAARRRGVEVRANCAVTGLVCEGGRCSGVLAGSEKISANNVVIAAGSFSSQIEGLERYAPTRPIRGQMMALRPAGANLRRVLRSEHGYLIPWRDGRVTAGSTLEDAGFAKHVTAGGMSRILGAALELAPALGEAEVVETWAGLRPDTPDHLPVLGPTDIEGLFIATGHFRNGIMLAPVTAKSMREWIVQGRPAMGAELDRFSPLRFHEAARKTHSTG